MSNQIITIPFDGQQIGQGFNRETGESIGTALSVTDISEDKVADGQTVFTSFQVVTDQDSLKESLGISAELDARYLLFSADAKVRFTESHAVNSYSSFVAGRSLVMNARRHGHGFHLTSDADAVLKQDNASDTHRFKTAFGDMFVRDLNTGGEFLVIARITSISEEHQHTLAASLSAAYNGIAAGGSFQADYNQAMQETHNHTEIAVWMTQSGGIGEQLSFTGPDAANIIARLKTFPETVHEHPVGYEAVLATYDTIPLPVPSPLVKEVIQIVLADCAQQKTDFLKAISDLTLAGGENGPLLFDDLPSKDVLTQLKGQYRTALSALLSHAIQVSTGQMDPPQLFVANPAPPAFSFKKKLFVPPALQVQIPDVSSMTVVNATQTLTRLGLTVVTQKEDVSRLWIEMRQIGGITGTTITEIIGTVPEAGKMVDPKSAVIIRVAGNIVG